MSETDPKRALRLFGEDLFISYFQYHQEELSNILFTLELPWDGSGYVSEKDSWKRLTERAAYEDKDVIYLNAYFSLSDSGYETDHNAVHYGDDKSIEINGIKAEYSVYDIPANPLWPDAVRGEFEYKNVPFIFWYSFGSYYNKKLRQEITEEQRQEMLNKAWDRITALLTV